MMKKLTALLTALFLLLGATALADEVIHIGIIQFAEHGSLDNCRIGFIEGLAEEGFVEGENVVFDVQNAQADTAISAQIADVMAGKYDMICAIATPAAMAAFNAAEDAGIPVIYTAVSDPVSAMLAGADGKNPGNITGTSDALNTSFIMDMMFAQNPDVAKVGLLYSLSEPNSTKPIAEANGCTIKLTTDVKDGVTGADVIYTDVWVSMGEPDEVWAERIAQLTPYRVTSEVMAMANPGAIFLHCLPSFHDTNTTIGAEKCEQFGITEQEVTDEVFESPASKVFDEAENRMHTIKAVMYATLK